VISAAKGHTASARYLRISPRKVRPLADSVRRKPYVEALALLDAFPHKGAKALRKVVKSAADNALVQNENLDEEALYVSHVEVNEAPRMKRIWIRGRGRADQLLKRMCHIDVAVATVGEEKE
jgi:large subunit ribosomal protein L22